MAILGLLLLLSAAGLAVGVVLENTASITVDAVGATFSLSPGWLFIAGVATGTIALLGLGMLAGGITQARRRRTALVETRDSLQGLQAERDRLAVELERERAARFSTTAAPRDDDGLAAHSDDSAVIDLDERSPAPRSA